MVTIKSIIFLIIFVFKIFIKKVKPINLNAIAFNENEKVQIYSHIINDFNDYSKRNNLDINIKLDLFTSKNSTLNSIDYFSLIETYLKKKTNKYDLFFYNSIYTVIFEKYFLNLKNYLPQEHIGLFPNIENSDLFYYNNKLVGLPTYIDYSVLYYNERLLNKYNKTVPKTWDQLLETGKYIINEEKKQNNPHLMGYNGSLIDDEIGTAGLIEFIYSFRDTVDSPFPDLISKNAVNAIKMLKKIKMEISSDSIYRSINYLLEKVEDGNGLFIKFGYFNLDIHPDYKITILPGNKEGISGSIIDAYNLSINKYISEEKIQAASKAVEFMTSKDIQKKLSMDFKKFSGIKELYEDEEVCTKNGDMCELIKNIQPVARPISLTNDYNAYSLKFRNYIYQYIYGNDQVDPYKELKKIDDITRIYYISLNSNNSITGKIIVSIYLALSLIILLSGIFLFIKKYQKNFNFLSKDFWILSLIAYVLLIFASYLDLEKVTQMRCHLKQIFQSVCFTFIFIPIFHRLISNFPEENNFSKWICRHQYLFFFGFLFMDLLVAGLLFITPFSIETVIVNHDKNFQLCKIRGVLSHLILILSIILKISILLISLFLIFLEWHLKITFHDVRICTIPLLNDILLIVMFIIFNFISKSNYHSYFAIRELLILLVSLSNYILLYGIRIFWKIIIKIENEFDKIRHFGHDLQNSISLKSNKPKNFSTTAVKQDNPSRYKFFSNFLKYHYRDEIIHSKNSLINDTINRYSINYSYHSNFLSLFKSQNQSQSQSQSQYQNQNFDKSLTIDITKYKEPKDTQELQNSS